MRRLWPVAVGTLLFPARLASAQGQAGLHLAVAAGDAFPAQSTRAELSAGYLGSLAVRFRSPGSEVGARVVVSYSKMKGNGPAHYAGVDAAIFSGTTDVVWTPRGDGLRPYFLGGAGLYRLRLAGTAVGLNGYPITHFARAQTHLGWNVGGGLAIPIARRVSISIEARVETSQTGSNDLLPSSFTRMPVTVGILF